MHKTCGRSVWTLCHWNLKLNIGVQTLWSNPFSVSTITLVGWHLKVTSSTSLNFWCLCPVVVNKPFNLGAQPSRCSQCCVRGLWYTTKKALSSSDKLFISLSFFVYISVQRKELLAYFDQGQTSLMSYFNPQQQIQPFSMTEMFWIRGLFLHSCCNL